SQRDIVRMIEACIEAPESLRFDVFYVVSNLRHGYRDVEHARTVLGWTPMDSADTPR
ncbi:MAG: NAD(P)-dependent oxidoreductase, partial [Candidatus Rokuibacteriota bacterium]